MSNALKILLDSTKVEAIKKAIGGDKAEMRVVFADATDESGNVTKTALEQAVEAFGKAAAIESAVPALAPTMQPMKPVVDKKGNPVLNDDGTPKMEPDGDPVIDESVFNGMQAAVAVVGARVKNEATKKMDSGIRAIVLFPMPDTERFLASENGTKWIAKVIEKEASHVAFRGLRNAETLDELIGEFDRMPRDVDAFVTESARESFATSEAFDTVWPSLRAQIKQDAPKLAEHIPAKAEVVRAIRSKAAALQIHEGLEMRGIFAWIGQQAIAFCDAWKNEKSGEPEPLDGGTIQLWLDNRETLDLSRTAPTALDDDDFAAIAGKLGL